MKKFLIGLVLTIVGITSLMLIPSTQKPAPMPWEVTTMEDGNSKVFDIHIGTSTYRHAQQVLRQYGKTAVFTEEGKPSTAEAFFDSINLGGLSGKLVLTLNATDDIVNSLISSALEARIQPSGAHRYVLNNSDQLIETVVTSITYIPSIKLKANMLRHRFGEPNLISADEENPATELWHYSDINLMVRRNDNEKTVLQYQSR